jgi:hypothetical protein
MGMNDYRYALEFRDMLKNLVAAEVERQRPRYQMATVVSIDRGNRKCEVQFPGESSTANVSMGSVQPSDLGQVVRVEGLAGDRYVSDVMGVPFIDDTISAHALLTVAHGATGAVVGTTNAQTLTNKNLTSTTNSFPRVLTPQVLGANVDLDTKTLDGSYIQNANANATLALHYPVAAAGLLTVDTQPGGGMVFQRYQVYSGLGSSVYVRGRYSGVWSAWQKLAWDADVGDLSGRVDGLEAELSVNGASGVTMSSGWTFGSFTALKVGRVCALMYNFTRSGAQIVSNSTGNIANTQIALINDSRFFPANPFAPVSTGWGGNMWSGYINNSGQIVVGGLDPNVPIDTGDILYGASTYLGN